MNVKEFNVGSIEPEAKDYERAAGLSSSYDDYIPDSGKAIRMANAIKDPFKLVRRSKAIVGAWGTEDYECKLSTENVWAPFENALRKMGFTEDQIDTISKFEIDENLLK